MLAGLRSDDTERATAESGRPSVPQPQRSFAGLRSDGGARFAAACRQTDARRGQQCQQDPDFAAVGGLIEGSKAYVLLAVCVFCKALSVLLLKSALQHVHAPLLMVFCHQTALVIILSLLGCLGAVAAPAASLAHLRAAIPHAVLESLEMAFFFGSLLKGSVPFVVALTAVASATLLPLASRCATRGKASDASLRSPWSSRQLTAVCVATGGAVLECYVHRRPVATTTACLTLWVAATALRGFWGALEEAPLSLVDAGAEGATSGRPCLFAVVPGGLWNGLLDSAQAPQPSPASRALLRHAMACMPVLAVALALQEGAAVARHEVSIPSVTTVALSAGLFAVAEATRLSMRSTDTISAALDSAYMLTLAAIITLGSPHVKGVAQAAGLVLVAAGGFVLRRATADAALLSPALPGPV
eukprot:jgi/Ulvmu1/9336/UM050_0086.1